MNKEAQTPGSHTLDHAVLNAMPLPVMVLDADMVVTAVNEAAQKLTADDPNLPMRRRTGELVRCLQARNGCGSGAECGDCVIQSCVRSTLEGWRMVRQKTRLKIGTLMASSEVDFLVSTTPFSYAGRKFALLVLEDITELTELRRLLPICARCKKIRDDHDYWHQLEGYLTRNLDIDFTHSCCPDCMALTMAELDTLSGP
jgi:PAS domain-containing protein